jgi:hypothetical protein
MRWQYHIVDTDADVVYFRDFRELLPRGDEAVAFAACTRCASHYPLSAIFFSIFLFIFAIKLDKKKKKNNNCTIANKTNLFYFFSILSPPPFLLTLLLLFILSLSHLILL